MPTATHYTLTDSPCSSDVRTDLPQYRVYRQGALVEQPADVTHLWREDLVSFYLGCSFTFESSLIAQGVPVRNVEQCRLCRTCSVAQLITVQSSNVPMFRTNVACKPAGPFSGNLVVSMRPMPRELVQVWPIALVHDRVRKSSNRKPSTSRSRCPWPMEHPSTVAKLLLSALLM